MAANTRAFSRRGTVVTIFGCNGVGACGPLDNVRKGDIVVGVFSVSTGASVSSQFESTITQPGQIQQSSAANNSGLEFDVMIQPGGP
jgi:hypothetical protein